MAFKTQTRKCIDPDVDGLAGPNARRGQKFESLRARPKCSATRQIKHPPLSNFRRHRCSLYGDRPPGDGREDVPLAALAPSGAVRHYPVHHVLQVVGFMGQAVERKEPTGSMVAHQPFGIVECRHESAHGAPGQRSAAAWARWRRRAPRSRPRASADRAEFARGPSPHRSARRRSPSPARPRAAAPAQALPGASAAHPDRSLRACRAHIDPAPGLTVLQTASRARRHKQVLERQGKRLGGQSPMLQTIALAMTRASCQRPDRPSA